MSATLVLGARCPRSSIARSLASMSPTTRRPCSLAPRPCGDLQDIASDVGKIAGMQRNDARAAKIELAERPLHVGQRDGARFAVVLRHDYVGPQPLEFLHVDPVDAQAIANDLPDPAIDGGAGQLGVDLRGRQLGKAFDPDRVVALVRYPHEPFPQPERRDDLGRAGDQRDGPKHPREVPTFDRARRGSERDRAPPRRCAGPARGTVRRRP